jgi:photosystem II stability/assembly factor-like uncharacterized protein
MIVASTYDGGIFRTTDRGTTWTQSNIGITYYQTANSLAVSGSTVFCAIANANPPFSPSIVRSTDEGTTWAGTTTTATNKAYLGYMNVVMMSGNCLFAASNSSEGGLFRSDDSGMTWSYISSGVFNPISISTGFANIFLAAPFGVYRSKDSGSTWLSSSQGITNQGINSVYSASTGLYTSTAGGIFISTDTGNHWRPSSTGLITYNINTIVEASVQNKFSLFAGASSGVFLSTDGGANWSDAGQGLPLGDPVLAFAIKDQVLYAGTKNSGVWRRPVTDFQNASVSAAPQKEVAIFPNPGANTITIPNTSNAMVLNLLGHDMYVSERPNGSDLTLDVSKLGSGTYFIRTETGTLLKFEKQ